MLTIYGRETSSNVQLVMWAVGELGLAHERLDYGHSFGGNKTPEYLEMNPMGLVPVLKDGGLVMFESAAILRYLAARYGDRRFWPADPIIRAPLDMWAEWGKNSFAPAMGRIFAQLVFAPPSKRNSAELDAAVAAIAPLAKIADERIGEGPWLAGETFTYADIGFAYILNRYYLLDFARAETPALDAHFERLKKRPAYAAHAMPSFEPLRGKD